VDLFDDTLRVFRSKTTTTEESVTLPEVATTTPAADNSTAFVREIEELELNEIPVKDPNPKV
jgi:hypothetical protein